MKVTCLALEADGAMWPEPEARAVAEWHGGGGPYWIHLSGGSPDVITTWLSSLGVDPGMLGLMQIGDDGTRIFPLPESVYVSAHPVPANDEANGPGRFACRALYWLVITMHDQPLQSSLLDEVPFTSLKLQEGTTAGVVCAFALAHSARLRQACGSAGRGRARRPNGCRCRRRFRRRSGDETPGADARRPGG